MTKQSEFRPVIMPPDLDDFLMCKGEWLEARPLHHHGPLVEGVVGNCMHVPEWVSRDSNIFEPIFGIITFFQIMTPKNSWLLSQ